MGIKRYLNQNIGAEEGMYGDLRFKCDLSLLSIILQLQCDETLVNSFLYWLLQVSDSTYG